VQDPYISFWSAADTLYEAPVSHWNGNAMDMVGMIVVDRTCFRFLGEYDGCPHTVEQESVVVHPTNTYYTFKIPLGSDDFKLKVRFMTPAFLDENKQNPNFDWTHALALPFTFVDVKVVGNVGKVPVRVYFDTTAAPVMSKVSDVAYNKTYVGGTGAIRDVSLWNKDSDFLDHNSDRVNWGKLHFIVDKAHAQSAAAGLQDARAHFATSRPDDAIPTSGKVDGLVVICDLYFQTSVRSAKFGIGYEEKVAHRFFGEDLKPYWMTMVPSPGGGSLSDFEELIQIVFTSGGFFVDGFAYSEQFDASIIDSLRRSAPASASDEQTQKYIDLGCLAYRQTTGAMKLAWREHFLLPWVFMKEISSDGDVSTVDVIYPAAPLILARNPLAFWQMMVPLMEYASNGTSDHKYDYTYPWAPHHLGYWPKSDILPSQQENMPVEETANMLILIDYVLQHRRDLSPLQTQRGNDDLTKLIRLIQRWGAYLLSSLPDPGSQLCTDDFEGPSPHNSNLALKGIVGLAAYADILGLLKLAAPPNLSHTIANYSTFWLQNAISSDADHFKLQYNLPHDTWSLKYNLLWDSVLRLNVFLPDQAGARSTLQNMTKLEIKFYLKKSRESGKLYPYGLPLDSRGPLAKSDWQMWVGALDDELFTEVTEKIWKFANETTDRCPITDYYDSRTAKNLGFRARPVVGGFFARVLLQKEHDARDAGVGFAELESSAEEVLFV
jgi:hypothetical protein